MQVHHKATGRAIESNKACEEPLWKPAILELREFVAILGDQDERMGRFGAKSRNVNYLSFFIKAGSARDFFNY